MIYKYSELKNRIKVGDKVRAAKGKYNPCSHLKDDGLNIEEIMKVDDEGFSINGCRHDYGQDGYLDLNPSPSWETLKKGDFIERDGEKRKVLGVLEDLVFVSRDDNFDKSDGYYYLKSELISNGWKVVGATAPEEMTEISMRGRCFIVSMDEVARKFGIPVERLRIKKEE
jgi:hypothetical protein